MTQPESNQSSGALNTLIQTLSIEEWEKALTAVKARRVAHDEHDEERRDVTQPRHEVVRRCLLRVDRGESAPGLYVVRSQDISGGGIRLIHGGALKAESICCVIIETTEGPSEAIGGEVAWCNPIDDTTPPAYEVGIRFYQPIQAECFIDSSDADEQAA